MAGLHPQYGKTWQRCDVYAESVIIFSDLTLCLARHMIFNLLKFNNKIGI